ncbi:hypothetical protein CIK99_03360 [Prevotella sp. P5-92]|nr:hypothetical protein CIK99_03360 [Prevotella sp. P5-92]
MLLLVTAMAMPKMAWAQVTTSQPDNGDGTAANPYQITTAAELAWFRDVVNAGKETACARLEANIDMSTVCHPANESESVAELSWVPIGNNSNRWHGEFNGNNKTISNLYINASEEYSGFFGYTHDPKGQRGIIKDIIFNNVNIKSTKEYFGVLAGYAWNTDISGITVNSGSINGYRVVGGIVGRALDTKISNCVNRISIVGSDYAIGGIVGYAKAYAQASSSITNCANYGNVKGSRMVGGIVGYSEGLTLCNVFSSGDVTFTNDYYGSGLVVGHVESSTLTISGYAIYNSDAKRYYNTTVQDPVALGKVTSLATVTGESNIKGLSSNLLKSGWGTWLLNGCKSEGEWGQTINTENYPVLNGTQIYPKDASMKCTYTNFSGTFTNTSSEASTVSLTHGTNTHYESIAPTCVEGRKEYYECNDCHKKFRDAVMTEEIDNTVINRTYAHHDFGNDYVCKNCNAPMPVATLGDADIVVEKTGDHNSQYGYKLYKYVADGTGTLHVKSYGDADTEGALWTSVGGEVASSVNNDDSSSSETDFSLTFDVTQGKTYIIGVRQKSHEAIEGDYILRLRGSWTETADRMGIEPFVWTGEGTDASPYELTSACHLLWFAKLVNNGNTTACARLEADIDMSKVCHAADESKGVAELSWEPISKSSNPWHGSFDGNNKTISNLYINTSAQYSGLFGYILNDYVRCSIKDIIFYNVNITSTADYSGVLAGNVKNTDISGITVNSGSINGTTDVGGIVGRANKTNITNCVNRIPIVGSKKNIGGIIGYVGENTSVTNCANYGDVKGYYYIGGIVGYIVDITLNNVFTSGNVTCRLTDPNCGLVAGYVYEKLTIQGHILYNSDAKIFYYSAEQTVQTIGNKKSYATITGESNIVGLNSENLKTGEGAWILNGQQSTGAWGQQLGTDDYPMLGDYKVIKAAKGDKDKNGNDTYWATFSNLNSDATLLVPSPRNLTVYNATVSNGKMTLKMRTDSQVAKEEGVLLKTDGEYVNAKANATDGLKAVDYTDNNLVATPATEKTINAETGYKLYRLTYNNSTDKTGLGFYLGLVKDENDNVISSDGSQLKATPGKAYLKVSTGAATNTATTALARSFVFPGDDETTGIGEIVIEGDAGISGSANANDRIYNLQGQQVTAPVKGLYIKNNKKVIIK